MPNIVKCPFCGGSIEKGHTTTESYERGSAVAVLKEIPCSKCSQCGETYFSEDVMVVIERKTELAFASGSEVSVMKFGTDAGQATGAMRAPRRGAAGARQAETPKEEQHGLGEMHP